jgi:hypothetical protein
MWFHQLQGDKMRKVVLRTAITTAVAVLATGAVSPNAEPVEQRSANITNGSFTQPRQGDGATDHWTYGKGSNEIVGWRVTKDDVQVYGSTFADTGSTAQALALNGGSAGAIQQEITTDAGQNYEVRFRYRQDTWENCKTDTNYKKTKQRFAIGYDDDAAGSLQSEPVDLGSADHPVSTTHYEWVNGSYEFKAVDDVTFLTFTSKTGGVGWHCGPLITKISVREK